MKKLDICDRCHFFAHSLHMVCPLYPSGVAGNECLDFRPQAGYEPPEEWQPLGAVTYAGEMICDPVKRLTEKEPARVHWDCEHCGWIDDSV